MAIPLKLGSNNWGPRLRILIVDDSKTIRRTLSRLLEKQGHETMTCCGGFEALALIADHRPDLIFIDVMMPILDGYQTCTLIKSNQAFKDIPVIFLTSESSPFDEARARIVGGSKYLCKPFTNNDVLAALWLP